MKRLAFLLLAFSLAVFAQSNTGTITGTVFDQSQAVMNGVKITATNLGTNLAQTATTNHDGIYSIPALEPGAYRLTLERAGFKKLIREPITVEGSGTVALDFNLTTAPGLASVSGLPCGTSASLRTRTSCGRRYVYSARRVL